MHNRVIKDLDVCPDRVRPARGDVRGAWMLCMKRLRELGPEGRRKTNGAPSAKHSIRIEGGIELANHFRPNREFTFIYWHAGRLASPNPGIVMIAAVRE